MKARSEVNLDEGRLVRVTEEHYEQALQCLRDHFLTDEPLHIVGGATWDADNIECHTRTLRQNISVMIVHETNGEVMTLLTNQVEQKGETHGSGMVWDYVHACENKANVFGYFNVDEAVQLFSLVTNRKYRQRGLGTKVVQASLAMIRNFGVGKVCVKGEGSSLYTQKIFEKVGMQCLYTGFYCEHEIDGKKVLDGTAIHDSIKMYGMMVE